MEIENDSLHFYGVSFRRNMMGGDQMAVCLVLTNCPRDGIISLKVELNLLFHVADDCYHDQHVYSGHVMQSGAQQDIDNTVSQHVDPHQKHFHFN